MSTHLTARLTLGKVPVSDRPLRVPVTASSQRQQGTGEVTFTPNMPVPVNVPAPTIPVPSTRWQISAIGGQWGAFQPWAGPVYWLRLFDTFGEAIQFVKSTMAKAAIAK